MLFESGSSEAYAIADGLNTIAMNDEESATDEFMLCCAEELAGHVQAVITTLRLPTTPLHTTRIGEAVSRLRLIAGGSTAIDVYGDIWSPDRRYAAVDYSRADAAKLQDQRLLASAYLEERPQLLARIAALELELEQAKDILWKPPAQA